MGTIRASMSSVISSPPETVYRLIADYRDGHPRILPSKYFPGLEVERGGYGAGTIIRFQVRLMGRVRNVRAEISEPSPGEELVETDLATGARTTFLVRPRTGGRESEVTIRTEWQSRGVRLLLEKTLAPPLLRRIYADELAQLEAVAGGTG